MRSKRVLTLLLAICMIVSLLAPTASAVTAGEHAYGSPSSADASADGRNDLLVSGEGLIRPNLRDDTSHVASADKNTGTQNGHWVATPSDTDVSVDLNTPEVPAFVEELRKVAEYYSENDVVSAFIVMEDKPMVEFYSSINAVPLREKELLKQQQDAVITMIEEDVLDGDTLDVTNQFTYLTNSIVVETAFGNLEQIARLPGVKSVFLTPVYEAVDTLEHVSHPYTVSSGEMSGVPTVWEDIGLTGSGMTIAILDTGLDMDHPSFAADPMLDDSSWDVDYVASMLDKLNAHALNPHVTAEDLYYSAKIPFAFNYYSGETDVNHNPSVGDHGSHVAGIAAANAVEGTGVVGMAPDAQVIPMQVFADTGGAYMDDILAALEDAMTLECDVVNMSLGSSAGFSDAADEEVDAIYARIAETDIIVNISAGNDGTSSYGNLWGTDLNTTANPDNAAVGSPSTYANVNSIASVDNAMMSVTALTLDGENYHMYNDALGLYVTFDSLANEEGREYVMVPGLGEPADFEGLDVEGKIAVIARGTINFSAKLANAEAAGAIGVIITNNVPGSIANFGMNMQDETTGDLAEGVSGYVPCVLVSMECGEEMAAAAESVVYVSAETVPMADENGGQVSVFSSWGVAPDLRLLPDMAGVGGNVYSCYDGGQYGYMSGTSMSAPQVSGMTALVVEYLKEELNITDEAKLRQMATSLLMSTAEPVISNATGLEASPRQQGAGLVNALNAVTSQAYLTVDATANHKPKAELGDGDGTYTFTFTVHNFGDTAKTYALRSSLLTEDAAVYDDGLYFMPGTQRELPGSVTFSADEITVAAGSSADVTVTVTVSQDGKDWLNKYYPNGGYVEGYVYLASADEAGVDLSLPFLGFYGDWTKAPAFDDAFWYENGLWSYDYYGVDGNQYYTLMWTSLGATDQDWLLGFNPYVGAYFDENGNVVYNESNNVVSPNGDGLIDNIAEMHVSLMRNAKTLTFTYTDEDGNVLDEISGNNASKTMYLSGYGQIVPFVHSWYIMDDYDFTDENGEVLPSGTKVTLTITSELDYEGEYTTQSIRIPITVDTTAPTLVGDVVESTVDGRNYVTVTVSDDALAYVAVMNPTGTRLLAEAADNEFTANQDGTYSVTLDVTGQGSELLIVVGDYGANEAAYDLVYTTENMPVVDTEALYAYRVHDAEIEFYEGYDYQFGWVTIGKEDAAVTELVSDAMEYYALTAAEYAGGYVFAADAGYNFIVMEPGLWNRRTICNLGVNAMDMAFDETTGTMYLMASGEDEWGSEICALYTIDLQTGELEMLKDYGSKYSAPYAMTFADGQLYAVRYYNSTFYQVYMGEPYEVEVDSGYGYTYTETVDTYDMVAVTDAEGNEIKLMTSSGGYVSPYYGQSMTYSQADGRIYWAYYSYSGTPELFVIDPADYSYTSIPFATDSEYVGLLTLDDDGYTVPEADSVTGVQLDTESLILIEGDTAQITAYALPWNAPKTPITWTSDDETVATVDENGKITAVAQGTASITASCGEASASCIVNVIHVEGQVYTYNYYNGTGEYGDWISLDLESMTTESLYESPVDFIAADYNGHDGNIYGYDMNGQFYRFTPATGECVALGTPVSSVPMDLAYDYSTGFMYAITTDQMAWTTTLHYVNMNTGALVDVATTYDVFVTLACDTEGGLYAISSAGVLYYLYLYESDWGGGGWFPLSGESYSPAAMAIEPTYIMEGLGELYYAQSMCFDHNNGVLLWAYPEQSTIYWIDLFADEPYVLDLGDPTGSGLLEYIGMYTVPAEIPELAYTPVAGVTAEDMLVMVGGKKLPAVSVDPLNATNQDITWTTEDESIAYVNEDGMVVGVSEGNAVITGTLVDGENTFEVSFNVAVKSSSDNVYGYIAQDLATYSGYVWAQIPVENPGSPDYVAEMPYMVYSEEYLDGKIYAYGYDDMDWEANFQFFVIDAATHQIESMTDMGDGFPFVYDMTYDYTTGTMYAVAGYNDSSSDLYMVNMENGKLVPVMSTEPFFMSLAAAADGTLYGISASELIFNEETYMEEYGNAKLYTFDLENGTYELAFDLGVKCNKLASMAFDHDNGNLYWTALYQENFYAVPFGGLFTIDLENETTYNRGNIGAAGSQVTGLYIVADQYPEAPESIIDVSLSAAMEEISVGQTITLETFVQPHGVEADFTWSSADESVATVDENGTVTGVAPGVTTVTVTVVDNGKTFTAACAIVVYGEDDCFLSYNITDHGFARISRQDTTLVTAANTDAEDVPAVRAAAMVDGVIYGYDVENGFFTTTEASGFLRTYLGEAGVETHADTETDRYFFEVRDMAYDAANGRMLAIGCESAEMTQEDWWGDVYTEVVELTGGCKVYEVDMTTGKLTELFNLTTPDGGYVQNLYCLTVAENGDVYVYSSYDDYVSTVNMETGMITQITTFQNQGIYGNSDGLPMAMEYDPVTCAIYILFTQNGNSYDLYKFNTTDKSLSPVGQVGQIVYDEASWANLGDDFAGLMIDAEHTHAWGQWIVVTDATCTEDGVKERACLLCGETETGVIEAGHQYAAVVVEPTCTEEGYTVHTCVGCGDSYTDTYVDPLGHDFAEWTVTQEPTDTRNGSMESVCTKCGEKVTMVLYAVLKGNDSQWTEGSQEGADFIINNGTDELLAVMVDGVVLDEDDYTLGEDGMTIILTPEFLATLEAGEHTLVAVYTDGMAVATFTIAAPEKDNGGNSDTGDGFNAAWIAALVVSLAGAAVLVLGRKKLFAK